MSVHELELRDLVLGVHLGCGEEERRESQDVSFTLRFRFKSEPVACRSDALDGTICYAEASRIVEDVIRGREFHLIEFLAREIFDRLKLHFGSAVLLSIVVHKLNPPVPHLRGGSLYRIEENE